MRVLFTNGTQRFWVKDPKKIKFWRRHATFSFSRIFELKAVEE